MAEGDDAGNRSRPPRTWLFEEDQFLSKAAALLSTAQRTEVEYIYIVLRQGSYAGSWHSGNVTLVNDRRFQDAGSCQFLRPKSPRS